MDKISKNKYFIQIKYIIATLLVLSSIFGLVSSWYSGQEEYYTYLVNGSNAKSVFLKSTSSGGMRSATLVIGIFGLIISVALYVNRNFAIAVIVLFALAVIFIFINFSLGGASITKTSVTNYDPPTQAEWTNIYGSSNIPYPKF